MRLPPLTLCLVSLTLLSHLPSARASCCCCCDCCCCCCCCDCCCCNNNNAAVSTLAIGAAQAAPPVDTAADTPVPAVAQQSPPPSAPAESPSLGPGLFPDGSTVGRTTSRIGEILPEIVESLGGPGLFPDGSTTQKTDGTGLLGRRRRRGVGFGKLDGSGFDNIDFDPLTAMGVHGKGQMPWAEQQQTAPPGLGPGLLPDGSTGRRPQVPHHHNDFFDGMDFQQMNGGGGRRKRSQQNECKCQQRCEDSCGGPCERIARCDQQQQQQTVFELGLLPVENVQLRNGTFLRYLLGLVPVEGNKGTPERERPPAQQQSDLSIARRILLIPPVEGAAGGRVARAAPPLEGLNKVETAITFPPVQLYKPVDANPENEEERLAEDYD